MGSDSGVQAVGSSPDLDTMRHSAAHLMAAAVERLFPGTRLGIGPNIEHGFYYDVDVPQRLTPEDLPRIEDEMRAIAAERLPFVREDVPIDEAIERFRAMGQDYKVELLTDLKERGTTRIASREDADVDPSNVDSASLYHTGAFVDLCRGPHVRHTGEIGPFKLLSLAGAYWRGDSARPQLQRIYGTAWPTQAALDQYLWRLEEAEKRDHRRLGRELELFMFHPWAPGEAFWLPKGATVYTLLSNYMRHLLVDTADYVEVRTPLVYNRALWETSGHWEKFRDVMFPVHTDNEEMGLKPMNCPGHMLIYASELRSYRDLPLRIHDQGVLHRNEASGVLSGLTRVRQFCQDDAHLFIRPDQLGDEVSGLLRLVGQVYGAFGLTYDVELSTRNPESYLGEVATWDAAEAELREALEANDVAYRVQPGEAAFYGPKIDFHVTDAIGRRWQCATIQLDYQLPQRFDLTYVGEDAQRHRPIVLHRAIFGSFERFIAMLIEHYAGAFPFWLAPVQAVVLPIADRHAEFAASVVKRLRDSGFRVTLDARRENLNHKIRQAQLQKIPYMLVVGDREVAADSVAVRLRSGENLGTLTVSQARARFVEEGSQYGLSSVY
ncbi:MAG TPA: threonine--tRNA ligase [Chloroflexota bacterium]|nr:threonine--tRNA ligase [Chloroflexota bacterium]